MAKYTTPKQIEKELSLLEKGDARTWGNIFLLIDSIDHTKYWVRDADFFTGWIQNNAWRLHAKPAMLWRILSAGRFVRQVAGRFKERGIAVPSFEEMPDSVSPDNIELLSKLDRVMPSDNLSELARRVFAGDVTRSELRSTWETYRTVLGGKTARGRGVIAPRLNQQDPEQYRSLMMAAILESFQAASPDWTGVQSPDVYKVYVHVNPEGSPKIPVGIYHFAAVVLVKNKNGLLKYHGVRFRSFSRSPGSYEKSLSYCDYLWVLNRSIAQNNRSEEAYLPDGVGIIDVRDGAVSVIRPAGTIEGAGLKKIEIASVLLARALRVK